MNRRPEMLQNLSCKLRGRKVGILSPKFASKCYDFLCELVGRLWATPFRDQADQPPGFEIRSSFVERGAGESEGSGRIGNRSALLSSSAQHLVFHLHHVGGVDKLTLMKHWVDDFFWVRV